MNSFEQNQIYMLASSYEERNSVEKTVGLLLVLPVSGSVDRDRVNSLPVPAQPVSTAGAPLGVGVGLPPQRTER